MSRRRLDRYILQLREGLSLPSSEFSVEETESLLRFAEASGIQPEGVGGSGFDLSSRPYLRPLYEESRDRPRSRLVIMKAAQMGLTVRMFFRAAWLTSDVNRRFNVALMFPTQEAVEDLHKTRFRPMMQSSRRMLKLIEGNVDASSVVRIGVSNMRFRGMASGISVDSFPADALLFDEVRLMDRSLLSRTMARVSDSEWVDERGMRGIVELNSTAGFPNSDIHSYFLRSTQNFWHTRCANIRCGNHNGFIMAETWPSCVDPAGMRYICPKCGVEIADTRSGFYEPLGPGDAEWDGYSFNQIMKGASHLPELWRAYERMVIHGENPTEFYNSYLGTPHFDPESVLVPPDRFRAASRVDPDYVWPRVGENPQGWVTSIGMDQRGGEKHVSIVRRSSDGRFYLAHLEVVELDGGEAVAYCVELARRWRVDIAVVDAYPAYDFAKDFGHALGRRLVWLAQYVHDRDQPVEWSDQTRVKSVRKTSGDAKYEQIVKLDRYKFLLQFFSLWREQRVVLPVNLTARTQILNRGGKKVPVYLALELQTHLENIARVRIPKMRRDERGVEVDTGQSHLTFSHRSVDPHFVHSMAYAVAGLMRESPKGRILVPLGREKTTVQRDPVMRELPQFVPVPRRPGKSQRVCGQCTFFDQPEDRLDGLCMNKRQIEKHGRGRAFLTQSNSASCAHFREIKET